jgi:hypothetical protein
MNELVILNPLFYITRFPRLILFLIMDSVKFYRISNAFSYSKVGAYVRASEVKQVKNKIAYNDRMNRNIFLSCRTLSNNILTSPFLIQAVPGCEVAVRFCPNKPSNQGYGTVKAKTGQCLPFPKLTDTKGKAAKTTFPEIVDAGKNPNQVLAHKRTVYEHVVGSKCTKPAKGWTEGWTGGRLIFGPGTVPVFSESDKLKRGMICF